ncbi:MAG TPA: nucleotidyltransferase family protein [Verrucomicrobiae bacterium]|nr:nucleotidyltransferase family protein [Verrucomicrobiae bacterium]
MKTLESVAHFAASRLGVVVLGAGASTRMGRSKLLLPWRGTTVIGHILDQWRRLGAGQIAVVCRPNDPALFGELDRLQLPAQNRIENPQPDRGMFSSIQCAANWEGWQHGLVGWVIVLGDQPHLRLETLEILVQTFGQAPEAICQPEFGGCGRHPVILSRAAFAGLRDSRAETLKQFLNQMAWPLNKCSIPDPGLALDLDSPEDYEWALKHDRWKR